MKKTTSFSDLPHDVIKKNIFPNLSINNSHLLPTLSRTTYDSKSTFRSELKKDYINWLKDKDILLVFILFIMQHKYSKINNLFQYLKKENDIPYPLIYAIEHNETKFKSVYLLDEAAKEYKKTLADTSFKIFEFFVKEYTTVSDYSNWGENNHYKYTEYYKKYLNNIILNLTFLGYNYSFDFKMKMKKIADWVINQFKFNWNDYVKRYNIYDKDNISIQKFLKTQENRIAL